MEIDIFRVHSAEWWVLGDGQWVVDSWCWVLGARFTMLGAGFMVLGSGFMVLGSGFMCWVHGLCAADRIVVVDEYKPETQRKERRSLVGLWCSVCACAHAHVSV